jgi:hypothetical protein
MDVVTVKMNGDPEATISRRRPERLDDFDLVAGIRERPSEQVPYLNAKLIKSGPWLR